MIFLQELFADVIMFVLIPVAIILRNPKIMKFSKNWILSHEVILRLYNGVKELGGFKKLFMFKSSNKIVPINNNCSEQLEKY